MLQRTRPFFRLERAGAEHAPIIQKICEAAPAYSLNVEGEVASADTAGEILAALPPGCSYGQKYCFVVYAENEAMGVVDLIDGYPARDVSFLGLLLLAEKWQGQGWGRLCYEAIESFAASQLACTKIQLGIVDTNPVRAFWEKMGFALTGKTAVHEGKNLKSTKRVMEKLV